MSRQTSHSLHTDSEAGEAVAALAAEAVDDAVEGLEDTVNLETGDAVDDAVGYRTGRAGRRS